MFQTLEVPGAREVAVIYQTYSPGSKCTLSSKTRLVMSELHSSPLKLLHSVEDLHLVLVFFICIILCVCFCVFRSVSCFNLL